MSRPRLWRRPATWDDMLRQCEVRNTLLAALARIERDEHERTVHALSRTLAGYFRRRDEAQSVTK